MAANRSRGLWPLLAVTALAGIGMFMVPTFIIRPFAYQSPRGLFWAMAIRQRAPLGSLLCALVCLPLVALLWQRTSRWGRAALATLMVFSAASAVMSRLNYFEWMFHPVDSPRFEAEDASKLDKSEMIMALRLGDDARAYPIREMAYHHILNDVVGGVPLEVTY